MLDFFTILTKGGVVLWSKTFARITGSPINSLIKDVLIEERGGTHSYNKDSYDLRWIFANELDLIFVVAYQKILQLTYIDELLVTIKKLFCDKFANLIRDTTRSHKYTFDDDFDSILRSIEEKDAREQQNKRKKPREFEETKKFRETVEGNKKLDAKDLVKPPLNPVISEDEITRNIEAIRINKGRGGKFKKGSKSSSIPTNDHSDDKKSARKKVMRVWDDKVTKEQMESLDYSGQNGDSDGSPEAIRQHLVDENQLGHFQNGHYVVQDLGEITEQDLAPVLAKMKEHLIKKNVAADISTHLCDSVARNLV
ncbi:619_t:CDS:2, partial [Acaulospora morrowiae]